MTSADILIVEDERILARDLENTLTRAGHRVPSLAISGEEAIHSARKYKPDLIIMDVVLQGKVDGIEAAGRIRDDLGIPVLFLSSFCDPCLVERAKATEAIGYLLKPYEEQDLLTTIDVALHQHRAVQRRSQKALLASETRFHRLFTANHLGMALVNAEGRITEANPALHRMLAYDAGALNEVPVSLLVHADDDQTEQRLFRELMAGRRDSYMLEQRNHCGGGGSIHVRTEVCRLSLDDNLNSPSAVRIVEDLTERNALKNSLNAVQRLTTISALASGLAHNLANDLTPSLIGIPLLRGDKNYEEQRELLDLMEKTLQRSARTVRQLLQLGSKQQIQPTLLDCRQIIEEIAAAIRATFPPSIRTEINLPASLPKILGRADELHQCLLNLCINARDAMPGGGKLTLAAKDVPVDSGTPGFRAELRTGQYVCLTVADTGSGMPPEVLEHIFEPFFTTKPAGRGTGLGLATTAEVTKRHGGFIQVTSQAGVGSEFHLYLPPASSGLEPCPPAPSHPVETVSPRGNDSTRAR